MTNHWIDIQHSDCILIQGSNAAENHPISFKWVMRAKERGAKLIHVDPRFTRTSSKADFYAPLRSGTDIAFLGGMIKYIIDNNRIFHDYVVNYTNAPFLVDGKFGFKDGLFTGYDADKRGYDKATWTYQKDANGIILRDETLKNPRCVYQLLKAHYARYDLKKVSSITGTPEKDLKTVYEMFSSTGTKDRAGTVMYALGQTHHTVGVQNIRALAIVQLLLGNIGVCGGGVNALRGEPNVQGSTDHALLYHYLPGYLSAPRASQQTLESYIKKITPSTTEAKSVNWQSNYGKYAVSLLKSWYGDAATKDNEFGYAWVPKADDGKDYSVMTLFDVMYAGKIKGMTVFGQNPACSIPNSNKVRAAFAKLDWMVHLNIFDNETASFWKGPGMDPGKVKTEVFLLPASASVEKAGSQTNSGRWIQWRYAATKSPGDCIYAGEAIIRIQNKLKELYQKEGGTFPDPILNMTSDGLADKGGYDAEKVAKLINGYFLADVEIGGKQYKKGDCVPSFALLQADGTSSSGNWICAGSFAQDGKNLMQRRGKADPTGLGLYPEWSFAWPVNRRVLYNRASCDPSGKPYNPKRAVLEWKDGKWVGDVPDGGWKPGEKLPFIMVREGRGQLFGPGRVDGPLPEHYEPFESPLAGNPLSPQRVNPTALHFAHEEKAVRDPRFPYVCTTYRVTEQWQSGTMTRKTAWLKEMQPDGFCEMSRELATQLGVQNGDQVVLESVRGKVQVVAIVTPRLKPFTVMGETVHQVGIPWQFGWGQKKNATFDSANLLSPSVGDPNTGIPETKVFMVNVRKAQPGKQG